MGSMWTGTSVGSRVRKQVARIASEEARVYVRETHRHGAGCEERHSCVRSVGPGPPAKEEMAREMQRASFCFVPPGDSAASSRLYDAIAALCVPVVVIDGPLLVPTSPYWAGAVITLNATAFLYAAPYAITRLLRTQSERYGTFCRALAALRDDLRAERVLTRAVKAAQETTGARHRRDASPAGQSLAVQVPITALDLRANPAVNPQEERRRLAQTRSWNRRASTTWY